MKLLEKALDKAIEMSGPIVALADGLRACAEGLEKLATNVAIIAHNQAVHHQLIMHMQNINQIVLTRLNESSLDTSMPDVVGQSGQKSDKDKPN